MAVYYKFKSGKEFDSVTIDGHFISVANLKDRIFQSKFGKGTGFDLILSNPQTDEEYLDETTLIPKNTSLLVRRVPVQRRLPIVTNQEDKKVQDTKAQPEQSANISFAMENISVPRYPEETEGDDFGDDLYAIPNTTFQSNHVVQDNLGSDKADEDNKIKALIDSSALDWQMQTQDRFGAGRGFGRSMGGRMGGGRGFGRSGFERTTPPQDYICHRCGVPGHFIQHCPTNGDPNFDKRRVKNPTGIPKDMLEVNPDGSYAIPGGAVVALKPNEAAFDREVEGLSSNRSVRELPPELHCPLCKEVMKDAVLTSKCCFSSYCDKCIRNHIISKSMCVCGATNVLADDLLPNKTVRDTINRFLEANDSSTENAGSVLQIPDTVSSRADQSRISSTTISAASQGGQVPPSVKKDTPALGESANGGQPVVISVKQSLDEGIVAKTADASEVTLESLPEKKQKSEGEGLHAEAEVQQKLCTVEPGKKKKKKSLYPVNVSEMQWRTPQTFPVENYMMPFTQPTYDPYWGSMQMGMDGYMAPYASAMPYMGYPPSQGCFMPVVPPQMDLSGLHMGFNPAPPMKFRPEFDTRKADNKRKLENNPHGQRDRFNDWERDREVNKNVVMSSMKSKSRAASTERNHHHRTEGTHAHERFYRETEPIKQANHRDKRTKESSGEDYKKPCPSSTTDRNKNRSGSKDSNMSASSSHHRASLDEHHDDRKPTNRRVEKGDSGIHKKSVMVMDQDSSEDDEDRHFKRRRTKYESQETELKEDTRAMRSSRESARYSERDHKDHRPRRSYR